jgi:hypothetical protein
VTDQAENPQEDNGMKEQPRQFVQADTAGTPAGWYPDPQMPGTMRYWDGAVWAPQQSMYAPVATPKYTPPDAVTMLVVSIIGFVACPFIGIWSFFSAKKAREEADRRGMQPDGQVTAAYIISIVDMVYSLVWATVIVLVFLPLIFLPFFVQ